MHEFTVLRSMRSGLQPTLASGAVPCVVAIPVRNEEGRIEACLDGLAAAAARAEPRMAIRIIALLNGCDDGTWNAIARWALHARICIDMVEVELASHMDHAGGARAVALRHALGLVADVEGAVVLTTDADTRVSADWFVRATSAIEAGCDVLAGDFDIDAASRAQWPVSLQHRHAQELRYSALLDEIDAACDPVAHNPAPTHRRCSGASLAFRASSLARLPFLPAPHAGEDRALVAACVAAGLRVRHDPQWRVVTSGRLVGRAQGGMADTLCCQHSLPDLPCDPLLEPVASHVFRATLRAQLRALFVPGMSALTLARVGGLRMRRGASMACAHFGEAWQSIENDFPPLARIPLIPAHLAAEAEQAAAWLHARTAMGWEAEVAA